MVVRSQSSEVDWDRTMEGACGFLGGIRSLIDSAVDNEVIEGGKEREGTTTGRARKFIGVRDTHGRGESADGPGASEMGEPADGWEMWGRVNSVDGPGFV